MCYGFVRTKQFWRSTNNENDQVRQSFEWNKSIISLNTLRQNNLADLAVPAQLDSYTSLTGGEIRRIGRIELLIMVGSQQHRMTFIVTDTEQESLINFTDFAVLVFYKPWTQVTDLRDRLHPTWEDTFNQWNLPEWVEVHEQGHEDEGCETSGKAQSRTSL